MSLPRKWTMRKSRKKNQDQLFFGGSLEKQDLFINSTLAHIGCDILWRMFKEGKTLYRGAYVNLETLKVTAIPV